MDDDTVREAQDRIATAHAEGREELDLQGLGLTSLPPTLFGLGKLRRLDLGGNRLAALPPEIAGLTALQSLDLSNTQLTQLPPEIARLTALRSLNLSNTQLTQLPPEIPWLTALQYLFLSNTQITQLPPEIARLTALQILFLSATQLSRLPPEIARLTSLGYLDLRNTQLTQLPPEIAGLTALYHLNLSNTQLTQLPPEIPRLTALRSLNLSNTQLTQLPPEIARLTALQRLDLRNTQLTELPPALGALTALAEAARGDGQPFINGLHIEGNPLPDPYPRLIAEGQPSATANVLAWLRGEPVLETLKPLPEGTGDDPAPTLPPQQRRPHVEITAHGVFDFAPPDAFDSEGNNLRQLRRLHPGLRALGVELLAALPSGNSHHPVLHRRCAAYVALIDRALPDVNFELLYLEGIRLANARARDALDVASGELAPLPAEAEEALDSLLKAHGPFVMATAVGAEALPDEEAYEATPTERRLRREDAQATVKAIIAADGITLSPGLRDAVEGGAGEIGQGPNPARSGAAGTAQLRNLTAAILACAACAAPPLIGFVLAGPAGTIIGGAAAVPVFKAIENTKVFQAARGYMTERMDRLTEAEARQVLDSFARTHAALDQLEPALRRLGDRRGFEWIGPWLDWIRPRRPDQR
jgi:Leucine-rich repeat (LRR) protein